MAHNSLLNPEVFEYAFNKIRETGNDVSLQQMDEYIQKGRSIPRLIEIIGEVTYISSLATLYSTTRTSLAIQDKNLLDMIATHPISVYLRNSFRLARAVFELSPPEVVDHFLDRYYVHSKDFLNYYSWQTWYETKPSDDWRDHIWREHVINTVIEAANGGYALEALLERNILDVNELTINRVTYLTITGAKNLYR